MNKELISVIVPVYNVEKYLDQCIDSIINQTYKNLEIILVDDGSTDNSGKICDEYAKKDARIKVIHKDNGGLSSARNAGLDYCVIGGDLIAFVDSDDWIEPDMYEVLYKNLKEQQADIACVGYNTCYVNGKTEVISKEAALYTGDNIVLNCYANRYYAYAAWNKLYRSFVFENLRFPLGKYYEDVFIFFDILANVSSVYIIPEAKYNYRQRMSSIMREKFNVRILDNIICFEENLKIAIEKYPKLIPQATINLYKSYNFVLTTLEKSKDCKQNKKLTSELQNKMRKGISTIITNDKLGFKYKIRYISIAYSIKLYRLLVKLNKYLKLLAGKKEDYILFP